MAYTRANAVSDLAGIIHSTNTSKLTNLNELLQRAGRKVLAEIDPDETIRSTEITNGLHTDIYDYTAPNDLKGNKVVDLRKQARRQVGDSFSQSFSKEFDKRKLNNTIQVRNNSGTKTIRISKTTDYPPVVINEANHLTSNGTWAATASAQNLTRDNQYWLTGGASLNFDLASGGSTGYIENSTMAQVDLTDHDEISDIFVRVYIPDTSIITNFILRWGNDSSNYWSRTVTAPFDQSTFHTGWNILRFAWNGATETGTVAPATVDYLRLTVTYNGTAETDIRVNRIASSRAQIYELDYYSKFPFRTNGGTWQETISADDDIINLDTDAYNIFTFQLAIYAAQQLAEEGLAQLDISFYEKELYGIVGSRDRIGLYEKYRRDHSSQAIVQRGRYYRV